jgi:hypothetical protein
MNCYLHKSCGSIAYIDVSKMYSFLVENIVINPRSIKLAGLAHCQENGISEISFYCPECKKSNIPLNEIVIPCSHCGEIMELNVATKITNVSGVYCSKHVKMYNETNNSTFTLLGALEKYLLKGVK